MSKLGFALVQMLADDLPHLDAFYFNHAATDSPDQMFLTG